MEKIAERQQKILDAIIREYVATAEPVGSKFLQEKILTDVSSATIRNDMSALESAGYLISPHTSAGRVPTESGYRYFVQNLLQQVSLSADEKKALEHIWKNKLDSEIRLKLTAKLVAEVSTEGVFLSVGKSSLYYTGLTNLFSQPEFSSDSVRVSIASVIDHLDEKIVDLYKELSDGVEVRVGSDNPLGSDCSVVVTRYTLPEGISGVMGVLGPTRMDYDSNVTRISYIHNIICHHE